MPIFIRQYNTQVLEAIQAASRYNEWWSKPLNLGGTAGPGGGSGVPIGGLYGQLIQSKVAYDTTEAAYTGILTNIPSGSLVDNLAHIRHNLMIASGIAASGNMTVLDEGTPLGQANTMDFVGEGVTTSMVGVDATVEIPSGVWTPKGTDVHLRDGYIQIGVGTTVPLKQVHVSEVETVSTDLVTPSSTDRIVVTAQGSNSSMVLVTAQDTAGYRGIYRGIRAGGTLESPTVPPTDAVIMSMLATVYDGNSLQYTGEVAIEVDGLCDDQIAPARIVFKTSPDLSANRVERMRITASGWIGINQSAPEALLHVTGDSIFDPVTQMEIWSDKDLVFYSDSGSTAEITISPSLGKISTSTDTLTLHGGNNDIHMPTDDLTVGTWSSTQGKVVLEGDTLYGCIWVYAGYNAGSRRAFFKAYGGISLSLGVSNIQGGDLAQYRDNQNHFQLYVDASAAESATAMSLYGHLVVGETTPITIAGDTGTISTGGVLVLDPTSNLNIYATEIHASGIGRAYDAWQFDDTVDIKGLTIIEDNLIVDPTGTLITPDGTVHIHTSSAGTVQAQATGDDLVVEVGDNGGISILTPDDKIGVIYFGCPDDNTAGQIQYYHTTHTSGPKWQISLDQVSICDFKPAEVVFNDDSYDRDFRVESNNETHMVFVDGGNDRVGIAQGTPLFPLHVFDAAGGFGNDVADAAVVQFEIGASGGTACTAEWMTGTGSAFDIMLFAAGASPAFAVYLDNRNAAPIILLTTDTERFRVSDSEVVVNEPGNDIDFRVEGDTLSAIFHVNAGEDDMRFGSHVHITELNSDPTEVAGFVTLFGRDGVTGDEFINPNLYSKDDAGVVRNLGADYSYYEPRIGPSGYHALDDAFDDYSLDAKWQEFDPGSQDNTWSEEESGMVVTSNDTGGKTHMNSGYYQPIPSGLLDWAVVLRVSNINKRAGDWKAGIIILEDYNDLANTDMLTSRWYTGSAGMGLQASTWDDYNSSSIGHQSFISDKWSPHAWIRVRIADNGDKVNFAIDYSLDGVAWVEQQVPSGLRFVPTAVGFSTYHDFVSHEAKAVLGPFIFYEDSSLITIVKGDRVEVPQKMAHS